MNPTAPPFLTLREYFAAAALTGILAWPGGSGCKQCDAEDAAKEAVTFADALLARLAAVDRSPDHTR